jgi:hypothetical protein
MAGTKKRNPQDATLRNIRALKKRVAALERATRKQQQVLNDVLRVLHRSVSVLVTGVKAGER